MSKPVESSYIRISDSRGIAIARWGKRKVKGEEFSGNIGIQEVRILEDGKREYGETLYVPAGTLASLIMELQRMYNKLKEAES